jgi:hypothetical protein
MKADPAKANLKTLPERSGKKKSVPGLLCGSEVVHKMLQFPINFESMRLFER